MHGQVALQIHAVMQDSEHINRVLTLNAMGSEHHKMTTRSALARHMQRIHARRKVAQRRASLAVWRR